MSLESKEQLLLKIEELEIRLEESTQLIEAIQAGEVDAFAINGYNKQPEVYTLQSGDYAYRVLIEEFGEGAVNITEEGLIVYTNKYFYELIELPYEKVIGTLFFDLVHEDSKLKFEQLFIQALKNQSKGEINLIVNGQIIPVYISLTSLQPKLATVGIIITDLTEKKKNEEVILQYQKDLELKNIELVHSNSELASFAYIASHDLQEPLRKIQTFSNRLLDKEFEHFSDSTKDYFQRITAASTRMQNLITALLNYSRLNGDEVEYTLTDLNVIVEEVKANLNELIIEKKAVIETAPLPSLEIIPHQVYQLFSNIIINAIKYSKPGVPPLVTINASIVSANDIEKQSPFPGKKFWEIRISDNGIGFEQKYAEKIFELFQRLHGKKEHEGTGIGLAICKRIIQNHGGFIKATGIPGMGANFYCYIPQNK